MERGCEYINMESQNRIKNNMSLVYYVIRKYYPTYINDDDIKQTGMVGLCRAANTFDEEKSTFSTYAIKCICNEINHEFRDRKKHNGVLSLDYEYSNGSDEEITLKDMIVGQDDVDYVDTDFMYQNLNSFEREIIDCKKQGMTTVEMAKRFGCSHQNISKHIRRIKSKIE